MRRSTRDQKQSSTVVAIPKSDPIQVQPLKKQLAAPKKRKLDQISNGPADPSIQQQQQVPAKKRKLNDSAALIALPADPNLNGQSLVSDQKQNGQLLSALPKDNQKISARGRARGKKEEEKKAEIGKNEEQKADQQQQPQAKSVDKYQNVSKFFVPKLFTDLNANNCSKVTQYIDVTVFELYQKVKQEEIDNHRKPGEDENCPICMCELYENLEKMPETEVKEMHEKQLRQEMPIDVVVMSKCTDHCFHKACLEAQMGKQECIRCAVCNQIYGVLTGAMPTGTMDWKLTKTKNLFCEGYKGFGVWEIRYNFPDGKRNGVAYKGTRRHAYLPDTPEGREVLTLLVKAFERKLSFLVGTSVTTGQANCVVWNVHHKTNTEGGSSSFGYPDPTYFNRVKLELADRGVILENKDEIDHITSLPVGSRFVS